MDEFKADCSACAALCCIAFPFERSDDFALSKPADFACTHLRGNQCRIHEKLDQSGFPGCAHYDCLGAGQYVTQVVFAGKDATAVPDYLTSMTAAFRTMCKVQELRAMLSATKSLALPQEAHQSAASHLAALTPDDDWTEETLAQFARSPQEANIRGFLAQLGRHL